MTDEQYKVIVTHLRIIILFLGGIIGVLVVHH